MARMTTPAEDTLTALIHLLDREGYDAVTVDQLAREAGMSRASFFRNLGGKEEVVFADHAALLAHLEEFLRGTGLGVREALDELIGARRLVLGPGRYETLAVVADLEGEPVVTFTCPDDDARPVIEAIRADPDLTAIQTRASRMCRAPSPPWRSTRRARSPRTGRA